MMPPSEIYEPWDVVVVPFPFVERFGAKRRPAVVLSEGEFNAAGSTILAMITTAPGGECASDVRIAGLGPAGLPSRCVIRFKLFTLDNRLLIRRVGQLSTRDRSAARKALRKVLAAA